MLHITCAHVCTPLLYMWRPEEDYELIIRLGTKVQRDNSPSLSSPPCAIVLGSLPDHEANLAGQ